MQYSHSRVECFEKCPFKFKMRYLDGIETLPPADADNAFIVGTAAHTALEKGLSVAIKEYAFCYPILTDEHINEIIKLKSVIPKARAKLPDDGKFEVPIIHKDFIGFIDYLVPLDKGEYILFDFKYTSNAEKYKNSPQLHLYKYFFEKVNPGKKIVALYYLFIPKSNIRQKKTENLIEFRARLKSELAEKEPTIKRVDYDINKVIGFLFSIKQTLEAKEFPKNEDFLCKWCEFEEYCKKGWDYFMKLPENKRRTRDAVTRRVIWIYGAPFCGKTTFANGFPDPLMLNTDGNIKFVDAPYIRIRDEVTQEGRITKRKFAWEIFKDTIVELEKKDNTFKSIVVDLLEDIYEHCRIYMYDKLGITHESDDPFKAWDKIRGEFLNTLKRLMNLDYENIILISHEDATRDLTKKSGDKISSVKPNLPDKVAVKVAGMVDVVARIVADGEEHTFNFKSNEVIFGGGRLKVTRKDIPLEVGALFEVYDEANKGVKRRDKPIEPPQKENAINVSQEEKEIEQSANIAEKDMFFFDEGANRYWKVEAGNIKPTLDDMEGSKPITEKQYLEGIKTAEPEKQEDAPRRRRRKVREETDEEEIPF